MVERKEYLDQLWAWKDESLNKKLKNIYSDIGEDKNADNKKEYVVKLLNGHGGTGVFMCTGKTILSTLQAMFAVDEKLELLCQKKEEADGGDIRVHVLTMRTKQMILAQMKRVKISGDFRSNVSLGATGVIATAVMAVKRTPKALTLLESAKEEKGEELTKLEKFKIASPVYIPAMITGTATIACIFGSNIISKNQQAALMSAYALLDNSYKEYKKKTEELYGEDAGRQIREEIAKDK